MCVGEWRRNSIMVSAAACRNQLFSITVSQDVHDKVQMTETVQNNKILYVRKM